MAVFYNYFSRRTSSRGADHQHSAPGAAVKRSRWIMMIVGAALGLALILATLALFDSFNSPVRYAQRIYETKQTSYCAGDTATFSPVLLIARAGPSQVQVVRTLWRVTSEAPGLVRVRTPNGVALPSVIDTISVPSELAAGSYLFPNTPYDLPPWLPPDNYILANTTQTPTTFATGYSVPIHIRPCPLQ